MLLTLTTTHQPATDLGFLLHKHPDKHQQFSLSFGTAHVFYPEATAERCTVALVLDVDPIALVRGRAGSKNAGLLDQYVNDRPYAASSFLSVALRRVFGSALSGRSEHRGDLAERAIPLEARLTPLRCRGGIEVARTLFEPLGYNLDAIPVGEGPYWDVTIRGVASLGQMLTHLYVLIPVLDDQKHYWVAEDEIEKLIRHGEGWLPEHPARELITRRYLKHQKRLSRQALERLETVDGGASDEPDDAEEAPAPKRRLNEERLVQVAAALKASGAKSVMDLGCGSGRLLGLLLKERQYDRILGMDVSSRDLGLAEQRLHLDELSGPRRERIELIQGSLTYRDKRLVAFDAAAVVEVIEHLEPARLGAFADALFGTARPRTIVLTTPNAEYNARYETLGEGEMRHDDHRFEWTRAEFRAWAESTAERFGYQVRIEEVGEADPELGAPTEMGIFTCN